MLNNHLNDYKKLKKGIKRLHRIYVLKEAKKNEIGEIDLHAEQTDMRKAMEKNIEHFRDNLRKGKQIHADAYARIQGHNVILLRDINTLRKEDFNILKQKEMYDKLRAWTKARLNTTEIIGPAGGPGGAVNDDDELMETSDAKQAYIEHNAQMEQMDDEYDAIVYQKQQVDSQLAQLQEMYEMRMLQRQQQQMAAMQQAENEAAAASAEPGVPEGAETAAPADPATADA